MPAEPVATPMLSGLSPARVEALQRTAGNAAVVGLLHGSAPAVARQPAAAPAKETGEAISPFSSVQDAKSAVIGELENLTRQQLIGLDTFQRTADLKDPPKETPLAEKIITGLLMIAIDQALGGVAGSIATNIRLYGGAYGGKVAADVLYDAKASADAINDYLKESVKSGAKGLYAELFPPGKALDTTPVIAFFDREKRMASEMGANRVTEFTNKAAEYDAMDKDTALVALELLRKSTRDTARKEASAAGPTGTSTLSAYANLLAELRGGRTTEKEHAAGEKDAARLGPGPSPGVLSLKVRIDGMTPVIESASMGELNEHLRAGFADRTIGELGINVSARLTSHWHTWVARNTGGTVFVGPYETGQAGHYFTLNVMRKFAVPSEKRRLYANQSLTGAGGWGYFDEHDNRISFEEPGLWDDEEDVARKKDVRGVWDTFRGSMWEGAHKLMEDHIFKLKTPAKIDAG